MISNTAPLVICLFRDRQIQTQFKTAFDDLFRLVFPASPQDVLSQLEQEISENREQLPRAEQAVRAVICDTGSVIDATAESHSGYRMLQQIKDRYPDVLRVLVGEGVELDDLVRLTDRQLIQFCYELPVDKAQISSLIYASGAIRKRDELHARALLPEQTPPRIMIVDDEVTATKYLRKHLERLDPSLSILCAANAEEALELTRQYPGQIAVVMTDQRMPGMSGDQLLRQLRQTQPSIVRILTSAYGEVDVAMDAVNEGRIFRYQKKPWQAEAILEMLRLALQDYADRAARSRSQDDLLKTSYEDILQTRKQSIIKTLCPVLEALLPDSGMPMTSLRDPATTLNAFFEELGRIDNIPVSPAHLRVSQDTDLEPELVRRLTNAIQLRWQEVSGIVPALTDGVSVIDGWPGIRKLGEHRSVPDAVTAVLLDLLQDIGSAAGIGADEWTVRKDADVVTLSGAEHRPFILLSHVLSPLNRVSDTLIRQQSALLILALLLALSGQRLSVRQSSQNRCLVIENINAGQERRDG